MVAVEIHRPASSPAPRDFWTRSCCFPGWTVSPSPPRCGNPSNCCGPGRLPCPRADQQPRHPAQPGLGMAVLGGAAVRSARRILHPARVFHDPYQSHPPQLDRGGHSRLSALPIVDPRGLVTPLFDGWSIDCWIVHEDGHCSFPRGCPMSQRLEMDAEPADHHPFGDGEYRPGIGSGGGPAVRDSGLPYTLHRVRPRPGDGWLFPCGPTIPKGSVSFTGIALLPDWQRLAGEWQAVAVCLEPAPDCTSFPATGRAMCYHRILEDDRSRNEVTCDVGMATAAALYTLEPGIHRRWSWRFRCAEPAHAHPPGRSAYRGRTLAEERSRDICALCRPRPTDAVPL